ncbi:MAG: flagellar protein FlaG [Betaproteobacteria bacterium]|nr:flagellar protein FlaG [Betaproteobacteria bacterium]
MSVFPIGSMLPALSSRDRGVQPGAPPPAVVAESGAARPQSSAPPPETREPERPAATEDARLRVAVEEANRHFREQSLNLQYSMDNDTKKMIIKLVDSESGEVIRQIPGEEMLAITRALDRALASGSGFAIRTEA